MDTEEEDITPGLHDEYSGKDEAMQEMECWKVDNHLKTCNKHNHA